MDCLGRHNFNGTISTTLAFIAQVVERSLGKTEVSGSSPDEGSLPFMASYLFGCGGFSQLSSWWHFVIKFCCKKSPPFGGQKVNLEPLGVWFCRRALLARFPANTKRTNPAPMQRQSLGQSQPLVAVPATD